MKRIAWGFIAFVLVGYAAYAQDGPNTTPFLHLKIDGAINPVVAEFIIDAIEEAERDGAQGVLVELDTPGGLDDSMRDIIKKILNTSVVVIVYVSPSGARAASAGALITLAADVAAMAPGTNIGAAHPVAMGGSMDKTMEKKVVNDAVAYIKGLAKKRNRNERWAERAVKDSISTSADEALKQNVVDVVAASVTELMDKIHGKVLKKGNATLTLATRGAELRPVGMSFRQRVLNTLSNPNIAYILMMIGIWGMFFELTNPGAIFPGVVGGLCLLLGLYSLQTLPVNYAGFALIGLGIVLLILEIKVTSYGMLTISGLIAMALGSMMLIKGPAPFLTISKSVILATVGATGALFALVMFAVVRAQQSAPASGAEGLSGEVGQALSLISSSGGKVFVHGEYWEAVSDEPLETGTKVKVKSVNGLTMKVGRA